VVFLSGSDKPDTRLTKYLLTGVVMKTAVVYYSLDESCSFIAQEIKNRINADVVRIETVDCKKRNGFGKILWGGAMVMFNKKPPLKPYTFNPVNYDLIILGVPVWAGSVAPPMNSFLCSTKIEKKQIALYMCHGGGMGEAMDKFKVLLNGNTLLSVIDFKYPLKDNREDVKKRIGNWTIELSR
jgi:flavodoxin